MKVIKAKVKLHLVEDNWNLYLEIRLKVEGELFYWHDRKVVGKSFMENMPKELFYAEVIKFVTDIKNTEMAGESLLREIIKDRVKH